MDQPWKSETGRIEWLDNDRLVDDFFTVDLVTLRHAMLSGEISGPLRRFLLRRPDAVCALVYHKDRDSLYFVRQFRIGPASKSDPAWLTECAAGLVDGDESPEQAIIREVREELGFEISAPLRVGMIYPSAAIISERIYLYYVEVVDDQRVAEGGGMAHEHEDLEIIEVSAGRVKEMIESPDLTDAKTLVLLHWFLREKGAS